MSTKCKDLRDPDAVHFSPHPLGNLSLASPGKAIATVQQHANISALFEHDTRMSLRSCSQSTQLHVSLLFPHLRHLIHELLDPRPVALEQSPALRESMAHHRLIHERLAKRFTLQAVVEDRAESHARLPARADGDGQTLVVEVGHDVAHALALFADQILDWHFDVVELNESRPSADLPRDFETAHGDAWVAFKRHDEHRETARAGTAGSDGHGGVVGPDAVGDPLLRAVDDVLLAVLGLDRGGFDVRDVAASIGLSDGDARSFPAPEQIRQEALLQLLGAELDDWGDSKGHSGRHAGGRAGQAGAVHLVNVDEVVEGGEVFDLDYAQDVVDAASFQLLDREWRRQGRDEHVVLGEGLEEVLRDGFLFLPLENEGRQVLGDEVSACFLPFA